MNIVYASNDGYARHLTVSMVSLFDKNQREPRIHVYVLSMGISAESRENLRKLAVRYGRQISFQELGDLESRFDYRVDTRGFDISALGRFFLGQFLPETVERVIYLDCDTVVLRPLKRLWNAGLNGRVLGAVMEPTIYREVKRKIGLEDKDPYFNSGMLLIDLKRWREQQVERRLLDFYRDKGGNLFACDQDTINGALKWNIQPLWPGYNFFTNYRYFSYRELRKHSSSYCAVTEMEFEKAKKHPAVVHYMGDERPWIAGNLNHYRRAYDYYLAKTPWAGTPREEGKRLYMLAYHLMDYLTVLWPGGRWLISRHLGMKAVDARGKGKS